MNKTELIDAIQQVITPNSKKAISAESLANLLIEMVNATPEGGNGGSGQVVFYAGVPNEGTTELYLTPEQKAHNAEMVQLIKNSPISLCSSIDVTGLMIEDMSKEYAGVDFTGIKYNFNCDNTMYVPAHIAELEALPCAGVMVFCEISLFITEDGSVSLLVFN
jgi:hypothetical protein